MYSGDSLHFIGEDFLLNDEKELYTITVWALLIPEFYRINLNDYNIDELNAMMSTNYLHRGFIYRQETYLRDMYLDVFSSWFTFNFWERHPQWKEIFDPTLDIVMNETAKSRQSHSYHCSPCNVYVETLPEYKVHLQDWHNIGETEGKLTCFGCKKQWRTKITKRKSTYGFLCKCTNLNSQIDSNGKCESHDTDRLKVAECHRKTNEKNIDYSRWRHKKKLCFYCPLEFISLTDFILHIEGTHQDRDIR